MAHGVEHGEPQGKSGSWFAPVCMLSQCSPCAWILLFPVCLLQQWPSSPALSSVNILSLFAHPQSPLCAVFMVNARVCEGQRLGSPQQNQAHTLQESIEEW